MSPSGPFIQRPIATALLWVAVFLAGLVSFFLLPVSALPEVDYPTIQVQTFYPGASPTVMASAVTAPLERQFGQVAGLAQMTSISSGGCSVIVMRFQLSLDIDVAEQEVQAAINAAQSYLPADLPVPPTYSKSNPADAPVLTLALSSREMSLAKVEDLADTRFAPKLSQISGVGLVSISGGQKPAVRIRANPAALAAYGIDLEDVRNAISGNSLNAAKGNLDGPATGYTINANDQLQSAADYRRLVVAFRDGAPVFLDAVAGIKDGIEDARQAAWVDGTPAVILNIQRQPGANTIAVVDSIEKLLPQLESGLPKAVHVQVVTDRTVAIRASVHDVEFELLLAIGLVVAIIFIFLRSLPATIIPGITVPLSLVGTFIVMYLAGYSLNNLAMMALTISAGFLVDDAIVMIENISRFIEQGDEPFAAAKKGAEQIGFTIMSLTVSLVAVLIPLLFMGDVAGRLFRQFAVILAVTIVISALVSLTLTPMMAAHLLKRRPPERQSRFQRWSEGVFQAVVDAYGRSLRAVLGHRVVTGLAALATLALTAVLYAGIPKGFFPTQDTGIVQGVSRADATISFAAMAKNQQALAKALSADPAVAGVSSFIGVDGTNTSLNGGRLQINLKPRGQRDDATTVIRRLAERARDVAGIRVYLLPVQDLTVDDRISADQYQFTLEDPDQSELDRVTHDLVARLRGLPQLSDVVTDQQPGGRALSVHIDRSTAARMGITPQTIDDTLYDAFGQRQVDTIYTQLNQYHVVLEAGTGARVDAHAFDHLYIHSTTLAAAASAGAVSSSGGGAGKSGSAAGGTVLGAGSGPASSATSGAAATSPTSQQSGASAAGGSSQSLGGSSAAQGGSGGDAGAVAGPVPLSAFLSIRMQTEDLTINHQGQFPAATISFDLAPGCSLGQALTAIDAEVDKARLPPSVIPGYQGAAEAFSSSLENEGLLILAAMITVYIVLGVLYESLVHPITILSTLPSAGVGALLALLIARMDLDIVGIIGIILLIGIVQKNGIMMVDFALDLQRRQGRRPDEAIYQACLLRFRPILMTTMAALLCGLPLAFGSGIGAELRRPLGLAIIGGLLISQLLTLYTTPVVYLFLEAVGARFARKPAQAPAKASAAPPDPASGAAQPS